MRTIPLALHRIYRRSFAILFMAWAMWKVKFVHGNQIALQPSISIALLHCIHVWPKKRMSCSPFYGWKQIEMDALINGLRCRGNRAALIIPDSVHWTEKWARKRNVNMRNKWRFAACATLVRKKWTIIGQSLYDSSGLHIINTRNGLQQQH